MIISNRIEKFAIRRLYKLIAIKSKGSYHLEE